MSWHYRVLRHPEGRLALHEVYCDEAGKPHSYTTEPVSFGADEEEGLDGIVGALEMALQDARARPILNTSDIVARPGIDAAERDVELVEDGEGMSIILRGAVLRAYTEAAAAKGMTVGALIEDVLRKALMEGSS